MTEFEYEDEATIIDQLAIEAEALIQAIVKRGSPQRALIGLTVENDLVLIPLFELRIKRRDQLNFFSWIRKKAAWKAYAYITTVAVAVNDDASRLEKQIQAYIFTKSSGSVVSFKAERDGQAGSGSENSQTRTDIPTSGVSKALFYFFNAPKVGLFAHWRLKSEWKRIEGLVKQVPSTRVKEAIEKRKRVRRFPGWSSDSALSFDGKTANERFEQFANRLGLTKRDPEAAATMSRASLHRISYLASRPLTASEKAFALVVLTDTFSQWLNVDWGETRLRAFSVECLKLEHIRDMNFEANLVEAKKFDSLGGDLFTRNLALAAKIGTATKSTLIEGDEHPLACAVDELCSAKLV